MREWLKANSIEDVAKFYNPKYQKHGIGNFKANRDWIIKLIEEYGGLVDTSKNVLDAGCGHGEFIAALRGIPVCLGIDISEEAIRLATDRNVENAMFLQMAIEEITSGLIEHFDYVTCLGALEHCENIIGCFKALFQTVKIGGVILLQMPLDYEGAFKDLELEPNLKTNERFASMEEWIELFSKVAVPVHSEIVGQDAVLIYKKES